VKTRATSPKSGPTTRKAAQFSDAEKAAMRARVQELKSDKEDMEGDVLAKIAEMQPSDRALAERIHALVKRTVPGLKPRLWYGMPAYAGNGKMLCYFKAAQKFKTRYATFGFSDAARLDDGNVWPSEYAVMKLTPADESRIADLLKKAAG
jgi:uncharacterized protein YdhG (YjbR/CyaY superfamily)